MKEVYILIITKEIQDSRPEVQLAAYGDIESAVSAYSVAVDEAREEAESYELPHEDSEIATETYRYFRIEDLYSNDAVTVEIYTRDIIGGEPEDI